MKRIKAFLAALLLSVASLLSLNISQVFAATCTWTGATNNNFNTAANWSGCGSGVPQNGDNLTFDVTGLSADTTLTNDIANLSAATVTFTGSGNNRYTIAGNGLTITAGIVANTAALLDINVTLGGSQTWSGTGGYIAIGLFEANKTLALGSNDLTINSSLTLYGPLTGSGNITVNNEFSAMASSPSRTGTTTVNNGGILQIHKMDSLGTSAGLVTIGSSGMFTFCKPAGGTFANPLSIGGEGQSGYGIVRSTPACGIGGGSSGSNPDANVTLSGAVTLTANSKVYTGGEMKVTGPLSGSFTLGVIAGSPGSLVIDSSNNTSLTPNGSQSAPAETITVEAGDDQPSTPVNVLNNQTYVINGVRGDTRVEVGGTLKGTGKVGNLDAFGKVAPGLSPGCLTTGNLTFNAGSAYDFEIGGTTACSDYDQLKTIGTVSLTGGTVNATIVNGFKPAKDQVYVIVDNDSSDAVTGTFTDLPEGATFSVGGYVYKISYVGGDGNDITLTVMNVPAAPDTGFAMLNNNSLAGIVGLIAGGAVLLLFARRFKHRTVRARR